MSDCLFCKIVKKEIPCNKVYENENFVGFFDIDPKAPTHILVIPKKHFENVYELVQSDLSLTSELMKVATQIAKQENLNNGFRIVINTGKDGGQSVFHVHAHVLGGRSLSWPPG